VADEVKGLDQEARAALRNLGVRFGAYHLTVPALLKPAPRSLAAQLWALKHGGPEVHGLSDILHLAASGRTSIPVDKEVHKGLYRAAGFRVCGERAVRVDILERLADLIRPAIHYRPGTTPGEPPPGTADGEGFVVTTSMTSLCGCAGEDFASILRSLGYVMDRRPGPAITAPLVAAAPTVPATPLTASSATPGEPAGETSAETAATAEDAPARTGQASEEQAIPVETAVRAEPAVEPAPAPEPAPEVTAEAPAEGPAGEAASEAAAQAVPVEVPMIEVWRQHRHQGGRHQNNRRPQPRRTEGASPAEGRERGPRDGQRRDRGPRPERGPGGERPVAAQGATPAPSGDRPPRPERQDRPPRPQGEGRPDRGERRDSRPPRRDDRPEGGRGPKPQGGRPGGPRPDRDRGERQDRSWSSERPARERAPDPNSPFAKLLALKAELEAKQGKD
jgi:ATP-dependent RNA helicase SUPV3L1/SUV3